MRLQRVWTMLAVVAALLAVVATPALPHPGQGGPLTEEGDLDARHHLEEIGFHELLGNGFNTDVWAWASGDRLFATSGTWGTLTGSADTGEECPSETDDPSNPSKSGVKIVEATDPANPELVAKIGTVNGSTNNDIKVLTGVSTDAFEGDILAHSLEPCGVNLGHALVPGADEPPKPQTGFELYDVSDPTAPAHLGTYNNGGFGTHNLYLFDRPDLGKAYSATVFNDGDLSESDYVGFVQIVDITDPTSPAMVAQWSPADAESQGGPTFEELCQIRGSHFPSCNLHDVWVSDDGTLLYASYWDAGLVLLDISEPAAPQFIGQIQPGGTDNEGNTHVAVPYHLDGKHYVIVGDEDFIGPGPGPHVIVNETPDGAAISSGEQFPGTE
ncbi:MAG: hypothetical protein R3320_14535, partial [Nitriliruptorales bacterium]|nr:hypothetical protein [Nitriliruptorales bacterium]